MARPIFTYTKSILERVSFDRLLFHKELNKAMQNLLPYEIELLLVWLKNFTKNKPELQGIILNLE